MARPHSNPNRPASTSPFRPQSSESIPSYAPNRAKGAESHYTAAPLTVPDHLSIPGERELLRLPKSPGHDPIYDLSRSTWNLLILPCEANNFKPPIKSISLRQPGKTRGIRCIVLASAKAYFDRLIAETESTSETAVPTSGGHDSL
jgi:hypothetical protein